MSDQRLHGTAVDVNARDAAVAASLLLQHGCEVDTLRKALTRNSDGSASGPLARALNLLSVQGGEPMARAPSTFREQPTRTDVRLRQSRPEDLTQRALFEHLALRSAPGVFAFHPANGGWRSRIEAAILKGLGVRAGVPDVVAVKDGRTYALEIKSPGGRLTAAQNAAHAALRAAGAAVVTSYGLDDALAQLERWGLLRERASILR
jgi:hypothetical protein